MRYIFYLIVLLGSIGQASAQDVETLKKRIVDVHINTYYVQPGIKAQIDSIKRFSGSPDIMIRELYDYIDDAVVATYLEKLDGQGRWGDIDYTDKSRSGWDPLKHAERLLMMSRAYCCSTSNYYKNDAIKRSILLAMDYWHGAKLVCPNWWYNQIGAPKMMGGVYLLMEGELSAIQKQQAIEYMKHSKIGMTGQNKCWLAANVLIRGILQNDLELIRQCVDVFDALITTSDTEGIKPDWSFHQHGAQQQFGNYGLAYINTMSYWARMLRGTRFAFSDEKVAILHNYLVQGVGRTLWNGYMDMNACNRQLFKYAQRGKALSVGRAVINMTYANETMADQYNELLTNHIVGERESAMQKSITFYPYSDMLIARFANIYFSIKMSSPRVIGAEIVNRENLLGYHTGDGVTAISCKGDEYKDIFATFNWHQIPGTTTFQTDHFIKSHKGPYTFNNSLFVGGMSDENVGVAAEYFMKDDMEAKKSWIVCDGLMLCLGSGIKGKKDYDIATTINQCKLNGPVTMRVERDGKQRITHNSVCYTVLNGSAVQETMLAQGNWHRVAHFYDEQTVADSVFKLIIPHNSGVTTYAYTVQEDKAKLLPKVDIITLNDSCHHVHIPQLKKHIAILYKPGTLNFGKDVSVAVSKGCILQYEYGCKELPIIRIVEPTQKEEYIGLELAGKAYCFSESNTTTHEQMVNNGKEARIPLHKRKKQ
ncbi:MAG: polysaccharide lyase family 8 super-sandwich domain-containing protein [Marinifilaceae bacterium]